MAKRPNRPSARAPLAVACALALALQGAAAPVAWALSETAGAAEEPAAASGDPALADESGRADDVEGAATEGAIGEPSGGSEDGEPAEGSAGESAGSEGAAADAGAAGEEAEGAVSEDGEDVEDDAATLQAAGGATIQRDGEALPFDSFDAAVDAARTGDVIALAADAGDLVFDKVAGSATSFAIDLAGHTATSLSVESNAQVTVRSSAAGGAVRGASDEGVAVFYSGSGLLRIEGVGISCATSSTRAYGVLVEGRGDVELSGVDLAVSSERVDATGIGQTAARGGAVTIEGGSIRVATHTRGVSVYGVSSTSAGATLSIDGCPVSVRGTTSAVVGVEVAASAAVRGSVSATSVSAMAEGASGSVWGIRAAAQGASIRLSGASVAVASAADASVSPCWCLVSGSPTAPCEATWTLEGSCSLESSSGTEALIAGEPLRIGEAFSLADAASLSCSGLEGHVFAVADSAADLSSCARLFEPAENCAYRGWHAEAAGDRIAWAHADVAVNVGTGAAYPSVAEAVAQASAGDTVRLSADCETVGALSVDKALTIDLAGRTWEIDAVSQSASGPGDAIAFSGEGSLSIESSSGSGALAIVVGCMAESTASAQTPYAGIAVTGGGEVSLDGCRMTVAYRGASTASPQVTLYGVNVSSGSFALAGGARMSVRAAAEDGAFGATTVAGVYAGSGATSIDIASGTLVDVESNAAAVTAGQIYYPDTTAVGAAASRYADLVEVPLVEGSDFYNELQAAFATCAQFDSEHDPDGFVHGANVYYVSSLELPSGTVVWACSDPVDAEGEGKIESVVAKHAFVRSLYQAAADAYGVAAAESFAGSASVAGRVSAAADEGRAFAVYRTAQGSWNVREDALSASCGADPYRASTRDFDLRDFIGADAAASAVVYPSNADYTLVQEVLPQAAPVATAGEVEETAVALSEEEALSLPISQGDEVSVTFSGMRDANGSASAGRTATVGFGETLAESGSSAPRPSGFTADGVDYRFVGWRTANASSSDYVIDADLIDDAFPFGSNVSGATGGAATLYACYVPVAEGQHLVTFVADYNAVACAVDDGDVPDFAACLNVSGVTEPEKAVLEDGFSYEFAGWTAGRADAVLGEGEDASTGSLPAVAQDAVYTARFTAEENQVEIGFTYYRPSESGYAYSTAPGVELPWSADATAAAEEHVRIGDVVTADGFSYTFIGWSTRQSDREPLFADHVPATLTGAPSDEGGFQLFGIYDSTERAITVRFYVDGALYATAADVPASTTIYDALAASDHPGNPETDAEGVHFRGWNTSADAEGYLYASIVSVGEAAGSDAELSLYAIWSDPTTDVVVTFYDSDRTTVLYEMAVAPGSTVYASTGEDPEPTGPNAYLFTKWVDASGADFSPSDTPVTADVAVYASYLVDPSQPSGGSGTLIKPSTGGVLPVSSGGGALAASGSKGAIAKASAGAVAKDVSGADAKADDEIAAAPSEGGSSEGAGGEGANDLGSAAAAGPAADPAAAEAASNVAGVAIVVALALALVGGTAWWFASRRREEARERAEEEREDAATDPATGAVAESIRF